MTKQKEIWVLGHRNTSASKSFLWRDKIPNITDADIIILDFKTLTSLLVRPQLNHSERLPESWKFDPAAELAKVKECYNRLRTNVIRHIEDKIMGGGHVVYLLDHNTKSQNMCEDEEIMPFGIEMIGISEQIKICHQNHKFKKYLESIDNINYILEIPMQLTAGRSIITLALEEDSKITDKSNRLIGATFTIVHNNKSHGQLTFLPSSSSNVGVDMINIIVSRLRGHEREPPPSWTDELKIPGMNEIKTEIADLKAKRNKMNEDIVKLENKKKQLCQYNDLLFADDSQLEEAVKTAFILIGFNEITKTEDDGMDEDWRIKLKHTSDVQFGVLEVKGRVKRTSMNDMGKCHKWVENYHLLPQSIKVKGIFIPNQYRLQPYPASKDQRKWFEPNELDYAKTRNICIIPTYVLFEAVKKCLNEEPLDRRTIEQQIYNTNGVLEQL